MTLPLEEIPAQGVFYMMPLIKELRASRQKPSNASKTPVAKAMLIRTVSHQSSMASFSLWLPDGIIQ